DPAAPVGLTRQIAEQECPSTLPGRWARLRAVGLAHNVARSAPFRQARVGWTTSHMRASGNPTNGSGRTWCDGHGRTNGSCLHHVRCTLHDHRRGVDPRLMDVRGHDILMRRAILGWLAILMTAYLVSRLFGLLALPVFNDELIYIAWARAMQHGSLMAGIDEGKWLAI